MTKLNERLVDLVTRLDGLGPEPSLVDVAQTLTAARLTLADVAGHVQVNQQNYSRIPVVLRDQYELLVMTWLPGQASVPHDHAASICAMQVVQGTAVEGCYRIAPDGYVDLEYETTVRSGEVTAGQDAAVHTVRNPSQTREVLVTVHIYSPPLKDFRRFVSRPQVPADGQRRLAAHIPTIVVVGGGFSGSVTAAQILRRAGKAGADARVVLVERRGAVGEGLAYGAREPFHVLNVPAGRMSAWPDRPDDFVQWASQRYGAVRPEEFLPRQWYGEYVRESLLAAGRESGKASLSVALDEVRRVARHPAGGWMVHLARGGSLCADAVVLAIGHRQPSDPIGKAWTGPRTRFLADPWRPFAMNVVSPEEAVVVLGSGLTAVDTVLSLAKQTRHAPITLVSRHGALPQAHAARPLPPANLQALVAELIDMEGGVHARALLHKIRQAVREVEATGGDWRSVTDGLRPHTATLWQAMSIAERRRFLAHVRPIWEIHRHRMALAVAEKFHALLAQGAVRVVAGRVKSAEAREDGVRLVVAEKGRRQLNELHAGWVINCTGPMPSNSAESNPAIGSLLVDGWLRPDQLALGIETTTHGSAIDTNGTEVPDLFVVGTLCKPVFWESTAVPELRSQAAAVAEDVVDLLVRRQRSVPTDRVDEWKIQSDAA